MTIAALKKVTLVGQIKDKKKILRELQCIGCMHLVSLRLALVEVEKIISPRAVATHEAMKFLSEVPQRRYQIMRSPTFNVEKFVKTIEELKEAIRNANEERGFLKKRISDLEPWGDINFPPCERLAGYRLWFYVLPLRKLATLNDLEHPWQIVEQSHRNAYVVLLSTMEPDADALPVDRTHTGSLPLSELTNQLEEVEVKIEDLRAQRHAMTRFIHLLDVNLAEAENQASLASAEQQTLDSDTLVTLQGWVPSHAIDSVEAYATKAGLACLVEEPAPDENPPTLVEQPDNLRAGVDLTLFYQIPSYRSWDPTAMLLISFSLFFAMILADGGYGLVILLGLLLFWNRMDQSAAGRSYRLLGLALAGSSIIYGALIGSYFGLSPEKGALLGHIKILDIHDFDTMMKVSVICGVLHLCIANGMNAYSRRNQLVALSNVGWIVALVGGLLLWLFDPDTTENANAILLTIFGLVLVFLFSSERPIKRKADILKRLLDGLGSLASVMGAFGDVLSYMRLFALGLAGASLAITFNDLAASVYSALPGVGVFASILILAVGHLMNFGLAIMSGVVHGLRLNYIEFYKWGLPEEGTLFQRFARKETEL
ncbi:MAG: hypothetical protein JKY34_13460 [Kordiimonadaceae bacterium]|nr:hypothetical protein [Kordiimonadaceae bacterium]